MMVAEDTRGANVRVAPPLVFALGLLGGMALGYLVPVPTYLPKSIGLLAGIALIVIGVGLGLPAVMLFSRSGQDPKPWTPTPSLVFRGPYRFTRNPMYVGMTILQIGFGLSLDNLWVVLLAAPALIIVHRTAVLREEKYLTEKFGEPYRNYLNSVRRYL